MQRLLLVHQQPNKMPQLCKVLCHVFHLPVPRNGDSSPNCSYKPASMTMQLSLQIFSKVEQAMQIISPFNISMHLLQSLDSYTST